MNAKLQSGFLLVVSLFALQEDLPDWQVEVSAGKMAMDAGRYIDADRIYAGLVASRKTSGISNLRLAFALAHLALARTAEGRHMEAAGIIHQSIAVLATDSTDSAAHPEIAAAIWQVIGTCFYYQRQYGEAERAYVKSLDLLQKSEGGDSRAIVDLLSNLGSIYQIEHRNREAEAALSRATALIQKMNPVPAYLKASLLNNIAVLDRSSGRHACARLALEMALRLIGSCQDCDAVMIVHVENNLALEYMDQKRYKEAVDLFSRAVAVIQTGTPLPRTDVARILSHYAQCQRKFDKREIPRIQAQAKVILNKYPAQQSGDQVMDVTLRGK